MSTSLIPSNVRAVLLDAVGTLIYPHPSVASAYHAAGRRHGSRLGENELVERFAAAFSRHQPTDAESSPTDQRLERARWRQIVDDVFCDVSVRDDGLFQDLWEHFASPSSWRMYDDVADSWRGLVELGLVVGVASNFDDRLQRISQGMELLANCRHLYWSADVGFSKPNLHFYRAIEADLRLPANQLLMVGDDLVNDYRGAREAGWHAILLDRDGSTANSNPIYTLRQLLQPRRSSKVE